MGAGAVAVVPAGRQARLQQLGLLAAGSAWLAYTYSYSNATLGQAHLTIPVCPFYLLTGHPCPFCGGTRSFAATWRGDLFKAVHLYPVGPLLFVGCFASVLGLAALLLTGRTIKWSLPARLQLLVLELGLGALLLQWTLKLLWLGN